MTATALKKEMAMDEVQNNATFENDAADKRASEKRASDNRSSDNNTAWQKVCMKDDLVAFSGVAAGTKKACWGQIWKPPRFMPSADCVV